MAGSRVTHGASVVGQVAVQLTGAWQFVRVVNWGTVPLMAAAQVTGVTAPTLAWKADNVDVIPIGQSALVVVTGPPYDQGNSGTINPGVNVYVFAQTAGSDFTVTGASG